MADPGFTPQELDRLEDSLEDLGASLEADDLSPALRERLGEYEELLNLSREVLPLEDAPESVLAAVLAHAEDPVESDAAEKVSFWTRMRRSFLLPTLALAGSVAAVLLIIRPQVGTLGADESVGEDGLVAAKPEQSSLPAPASPAPAGGAAVQGDEALGEARRLGSPEAAVPAEALEAEADAAAAVEEKPRAKLDATKSEGGPRKKTAAPTKPSPKSEPMPAPSKDAQKVPPPADVTWTAVADADAKRRGNRCGLATITYREATASADPKLAARGHAGVGLCAERGGGDGAVHFARARKLDRSIDSFIRDERARAYRPGGKASKRKAKSNSDALDGL